MKVNLRIPGKLFIVGEYTSVEGSKSIILPTKKTINFEVISDKSFIILSNQWNSDIIYNPKNLDTNETWGKGLKICLLYTSPSPRDVEESRMPSSA